MTVTVTVTVQPMQHARTGCPDSDKFYCYHILKLVDSRYFTHANRKILLQNGYLHIFSLVNKNKPGCLWVKRVF